jgi:hypothetical protein
MSASINSERRSESTLGIDLVVELPRDIGFRHPHTPELNVYRVRRHRKDVKRCAVAVDRLDVN